MFCIYIYCVKVYLMEFPIYFVEKGLYELSLFVSKIQSEFMVMSDYRRIYYFMLMSLVT